MITGVFLFSLIVSCDRNPENSQNMLQLSKKPVVDQIRQRGKLIAVTRYNSVDYFLYHGEPAGYQFELLKAFARHLDVELEIIVRNDPVQAVHLLNRGQADLIAGDLLPEIVDTTRLDFTLPVGKTRLVIVQPLNPELFNAIRINKVSDLIGRTVMVADDYTEVVRMKKAVASLSIPVEIQKMDGVTAAETIKQVALGDLKYTVCDEKTAKTMAALFPNLDISVSFSPEQSTYWGIRKGAHAWGDLVAHWIETFIPSKGAASIYQRYFEKGNLRRAAASGLTQQARLSDYDQLLRKLTPTTGWDWRLIAALIYQESKFNHDVVSHKGAAGIMQLMPATATEYGIDSTSTPLQHIRAGIGLLSNINKQLKPIVADSVERLRFVLASYNVGVGHVLDARRLAVKNGQNPNLWLVVEPYLLKKAEPAYYTDEVVYYGYCRGDEPANFVRSIMKRYKHYQNLIEK